MLEVLRRYGPPVAWMALIALFSGDALGSDETASRILPLLGALLPAASPPLLHALHTALRKAGHVGEYTVLGALWLRALAPGRPPRRAARLAVAIAALYALVDEARQSLAPTRGASVLDVALDAASAFLAVAWLEPNGGLTGAAITLLRGGAAAVALLSLTAALAELPLGLAVWDLLLAALGAGLVFGLVSRLGRGWQAPAERPASVPSPRRGGDSS
jgi:VanZ family protein